MDFLRHTPVAQQWQYSKLLNAYQVKVAALGDQRNIKGPEDKPLLGGETVRGVVRWPGNRGNPRSWC